jgi:hypothetical protein
MSNLIGFLPSPLALPMRLWQAYMEMAEFFYMVIREEDDMWVSHVILYHDEFERHVLSSVVGGNNKRNK